MINNNAYFNTNTNANATDNTKYFVADNITNDSNPFNSGNIYPSVNTVNSLFATINSTDTDLTTTNVLSVYVVFRNGLNPGF